MRIPRKGFAIAMVGMLAATALAGCSTNTSSDHKADNSKASDTAKKDDSGSDSKADTKPAECGNQEQAGPEDFEFGPFDGAIHFFQPGMMSTNPYDTMHMLPYKDSQMHLELDLKANAYALNWGYSKDETPANLQVLYKITTKDGKEIDSGHFMEMNAVDGSHYGTNLKNDTIKAPGDYKIRITVLPPINYDLHADYKTGVPHAEWFKPLTVEKDWKITKQQFDTVKKNKVDDPMVPPEKCKAYPNKEHKDPKAEAAMKKAESETPLESKMKM